MKRFGLIGAGGYVAPKHMTAIKVWDNLKKEIDRGKKGYNVGLTMGFDRLTDHVCNIQQGRYDTIGGATGTGKTALVDRKSVV